MIVKVLLILALTLGVILLVILGIWAWKRQNAQLERCPRPALPWHAWRDGQTIQCSDGQSVSFSLLSENPLIVMITDFISETEGKHLQEIAASRLKRSTVQGNASGKNVESNERTSSSAYLEAAEDDIVSRIENRAVELSNYPLSHLEPIQVLRYEPGQRYTPHHDYFERNVLGSSGQRHATYFLYLCDESDGLEGGETEFPTLKLKITPKRNAAVFWYDCDEQGKEIPETLHAGLPPSKGEKWGCNLWIRERPTR